MSSSPRAFISYSSADKDRFVTNFASRLRSDGIDAWYDKWEILPGDSLVDKIFNEGIDQSDIVIIVISENSVNSHWVKEELNSAVIKKIEGKCRIIPILIDDCLIPVCLKNTAYEKIEDLENHEANYQRIRASIFQQPVKPPLGNTPIFLESGNLYINGLTKGDSWILETICRHAIMSKYPCILMISQINQEANEAGITDEQMSESLDILINRGYLIDKLNEGGTISAVEIPSTILEFYCEKCVNNYDQYVLSVISSIVNEKKIENNAISDYTGISVGIVTHILNYLSTIGKIGITTGMGGIVSVHPNNLSELKRMLS